MCYVTDIDENVERHNGDKAHAVPIHMRADRLDVKGRVEAKKKELEAGAAKAGPAAVAAGEKV